jgi:hypothetical protein
MLQGWLEIQAAKRTVNILASKHNV